MTEVDGRPGEGPPRVEPPAKPVSLWPREHGASMELGFPLLTAWLLGDPGGGSLLLGLGAILAFLAHEPLLLVLGKRGERKRIATTGPAIRRLVLLGLLAAAAGGTGLALASPTARLWTLVPAGGAALAVALAAFGKERSLPGELYIALVLTSISLPVAIAADVPPADALRAFLVWSAGFAVGTLAARGILIQKKDSGRGLRIALGAAILLAVLSPTVALLTPVSPWVALAPLPFALLGAALALRPPSPKRMHALGFGLTAACALTLTALLIGL